MKIEPCEQGEEGVGKEGMREKRGIKIYHVWIQIPYN